jgi:hypothetical protein
MTLLRVGLIYILPGLFSRLFDGRFARTALQLGFDYHPLLVTCWQTPQNQQVHASQI